MAIRHKSLSGSNLSRGNKSIKKQNRRFFKIRVALALGISILADILDYLAAPIFGIPILGDIFDVVVTGLLYLITKSKVSVVMNLAEFIPFLGDFLPVYTVSTILWVARDNEFDKLLIIRKIINLFSNKQSNV
ncbi:MAG TPA: hypothetical protein VJ772_04505 [Nitrososphaeraceae archaeon]|nr:hypothetical protein [Nitrososphaeraceae archaeon]